METIVLKRLILKRWKTTFTAAAATTTAAATSAAATGKHMY